MRTAVAIACIISLVLSSCASRQTEYLPPGTDPNQLLADVARRGQEMPHEAPPPPPEPTRADRALNTTGEVVLVAAVIGGVCLVAVPIILLCAKGHGHPHWTLPPLPPIHISPPPPDPDDRREPK
jgi:hypothetical protein